MNIWDQLEGVEKEPPDKEAPSDVTKRRSLSTGQIVAISLVGLLIAFGIYSALQPQPSVAAQEDVLTMQKFCMGDVSYGEMNDAKVDLSDQYTAGSVTATDLKLAADRLDDCNAEAAAALRSRADAGP